MENEYNLLEIKLYKSKINELEKIKILERQKELLLQFLIDSNKNLFNSLAKKQESKLPGILTFFKDEL